MPRPMPLPATDEHSDEDTLYTARRVPTLSDGERLARGLAVRAVADQIATDTRGRVLCDSVELLREIRDL